MLTADEARRKQDLYGHLAVLLEHKAKVEKWLTDCPRPDDITVTWSYGRGVHGYDELRHEIAAMVQADFAEIGRRAIQSIDAKIAIQQRKIGTAAN